MERTGTEVLSILSRLGQELDPTHRQMFADLRSGHAIDWAGEAAQRTWDTAAGTPLPSPALAGGLSLAVLDLATPPTPTTPVAPIQAAAAAAGGRAEDGGQEPEPETTQRLALLSLGDLTGAAALGLRQIGAFA